MEIKNIFTPGPIIKLMDQVRQVMSPLDSLLARAMSAA